MIETYPCLAHLNTGTRVLKFVLKVENVYAIVQGNFGGKGARTGFLK